jgi:hypothetical protein
MVDSINRDPFVGIYEFDFLCLVILLHNDICLCMFVDCGFFRYFRLLGFHIRYGVCYVYLRCRSGVYSG